MASIGLEIGWEYGARNCVYMYIIIIIHTVSTYAVYLTNRLAGGVQTKSLVEMIP